MHFSKAEKYLMNKDKKLKILITENGPINFKPNNKNASIIFTEKIFKNKLPNLHTSRDEDMQ